MREQERAFHLALGYRNLFPEDSRGSLLWRGIVLPVRKAAQYLVLTLALQIMAGPTQMVR